MKKAKSLMSLLMAMAIVMSMLATIPFAASASEPGDEITAGIGDVPADVGDATAGGDAEPGRDAEPGGDAATGGDATTGGGAMIADEDESTAEPAETAITTQAVTAKHDYSVNASSTLAAAISDVNHDPKTITLTSNIIHTTPITMDGSLDGNKKITINLNGFMLTVSVAGTGITLTNGASLAVNGPGMLVVSGGVSQSGVNTEFNRAANVTYVGVSDGWYTINTPQLGGNRQYYFINGILQTGWLQDGNNRRYLDPLYNGAMAIDWYAIKNAAGTETYWYYFGTKDDGEGILTLGWRQIPARTGGWYYFNASSGINQTGWTQIGNLWYYMDPRPNGSPARGGTLNDWRSINNQWYNFNADGSMRSGWFHEAGAATVGRSFYLGTGTTAAGNNTGAMRSAGWFIVDGKWYYHQTSGGIIKNRWETINGSQFYFNADGSMRSGWHTDSQGRTFYLGTGSTAAGNNTGAMRSAGWFMVDGKWYYHQATGGIIKNDWRSINGQWYYFNADGSMRSGWYTDSQGRTFYLGTGSTAGGNGTGPMRSPGWFVVDGKWYYHQATGGIIKNDWRSINGQWYYFNADGSMRSGWFHEAGASTIGRSFYLGNGNTASGNNTGGMRANQWLLIDGKWYFHQASGGIIKNDWHEDNGWFYFKADGSMAANERLYISGLGWRSFGSDGRLYDPLNMPIIIGDSITVDASSSVRNAIPGITVDAMNGRRMSQGLSIIRNMKNAGTLPNVVIVALGTNNETNTIGYLDSIVNEVGSGRKLILVTPPMGNGQYSPQNPVAQHMRNLANTYSWITLAEWSVASHNNPQVVDPDRIHLRWHQAGRDMYAAIIKNAYELAIAP